MEEDTRPSGVSPTNDRDTHFRGFAELLYQELSTLDGGHETIISEYRNKYDKQEILQLIAQRAYDLTYHTRRRTAYGMDLLVIRSWIAEDVPDMTEWPKRPGEHS
jgi:hypothetical protein